MAGRMSDNATLMERLRTHARLSHSYSSGTDTLEEHLDWEAAARIAELEDALGGARHVQREMDARIAELEAELVKYEKLLLDCEAERDRLTAALAEAQGYTRGLLGLCQLLGSRDDIPAAVKEVLRSNHRVVDAARSTS